MSSGTNYFQINENKTLKLTNGVMVKLEDDDFSVIPKVIEQLDNYIKSKGSIPFGPLVQYTISESLDDGTTEIKSYMIRQSNNFIIHIYANLLLKQKIVYTAATLGQKQK